MSYLWTKFNYSLNNRLIFYFNFLIIFRGDKKFFLEITLAVNSISDIFRAFPATAPPRLATFLFSGMPVDYSFLDISVVIFSPSIVKINSKSVILSRRLALVLLGIFLNFLYCLGVIPKVALLISAVKIAKLFCLIIFLFRYSSVNSCRIAIPHNRLSIQPLG